MACMCTSNQLFSLSVDAGNTVWKVIEDDEGQLFLSDEYSKAAGFTGRELPCKIIAVRKMIQNSTWNIIVHTV